MVLGVWLGRPADTGQNSAVRSLLEMPSDGEMSKGLMNRLRIEIVQTIDRNVI